MERKEAANRCSFKHGSRIYGNVNCHLGNYVAPTLLSELGFRQETATPLQTDNRSAIDLVNNPAFHGRSKHIDIRHHFIRECVASNEVTVRHCTSEVNTADVLTKVLPKVWHWELLTLAGMTPE